MKNKLYSLHYARGLAALIVLLFHFSSYGIPIFKELIIFKHFGRKGVDLFFFISGFVIYSSLNSGSNNFWKGRFYRLFPVYWFSLVLILSLQFYGNDGRLFGNDGYLDSDQLNVFFWNFSMLQSFFGIADLDGAAWTLGVELNFYVLAFTLNRYFNKSKTLFIYTSLVFLQLLFRIDAIGMPYESFFNRFFLGNYLSLFVLGIFAKVLLDSRENKWDGKNIFNKSFLTIPLVVQALQYYKVKDWGGGVVLIIIGVLILILMLAEGKISRKPLGALNFLGNISYPLYLLHGSIAIFGRNVIGNDALLFIWCLIVPIFISYLTHVYIETPFSTRWKTITST